MAKDVWKEMSAAILCDRQGLAKVLRDLLKLAQVGQVRVFSDAFSVEAAEALRDVDFSLMLLDEDGLHTLDLLRRHPNSPNPYMTALFLAVDVQAADIRTAIHYGVHDVIALPASAKQVRQRVGRAVLVGRPWITTGHYTGPCRRRSLKGEWREKERRRNASDELAGRVATEARVKQQLGL